MSEAVATTNYAVAPGEYLKEWIDEQGFSRQHVADLLGCSLTHVNELLNGRAPIAEDTAIRLERAVGIPAGSWLRYEAAYRADLARISDQEDRVAAVVRCPFCDRIRRGEYDDLFGAVARFEPLNPVTPGHMLFVPAVHVEHPNWGAVGNAMKHAELYASGQPWDFNLITSSGPAATQSVRHIHVHYVPRREGDGLHLPWTSQKKEA